jgi:plasmid stabilization system protein ParE
MAPEEKPLMPQRFVVSPRADGDLEEQADYYSERQNLELGLRFLRYARLELSPAGLASGHRQHATI